MPYTPEQQAALELQGASVVLSAGAGCGKTFVLTERFLRQLDPAGQGPRPDVLSRLVAITFTQRAAREMRQRIRRHCQQRADQATDPEVRRRWQHLLHQLHTARISTIDSFCVSLLRRWPVEAELDPEFRVADEFESRVMQCQILKDSLRQLLAQGDPVLLFVARSQGLHWLRTTLAEMLEKAPFVDFCSWSASGTSSLEPPGPPAQWFPQQLLAPALALWQGWREALLERLKQLREQLLEHDVERLYRGLRAARLSGASSEQNRQVWVEQLPRLMEGPLEQLPRVVRRIRAAWRFQGRWRDDPYGDLGEQVKQFKQALGPLVDFCPDWKLLWHEAQLTAAMSHLTCQLYEKYQQHKREQAVVDFADLLSHSVRLLRQHKQVRRQESKQIELLLVDEFQDTNPLQVELIRLLLDDDLASGRLFLVGDYKQSIYRFRNAVPEQFLQVREEIPRRGRLPLSRNFRSRPQVLRFVNALFEGAFAHEYEPLHAHKRETKPPCTVEFLWAMPEEGQSFGKVDEVRQREADLIARRIAMMLEQQEPLVYREHDGQVQPRPVAPGDVAVLFRTLSDLPLYEAALQRYDIPYYVVRGKAFFAQQEVYDLTHLLRVVLWPEDEVALLGVLRSPIFGIRDDVLVALGRPLAGNFYRACWPENVPEAQRQGLQHAHAVLADLHQAKDRVSVSELILRALRQTGYEAALLADFLGQRKLANLHKLLDMARAADATGGMTLADFVYQLESLVAQEPEEPSAALHPEAHGAVKLMSIHQSKGLEFPVVVVADCNRRDRAGQVPFHYHEQLGPVVRASDQEREGTSAFELLEQREQEQRRQEALRLFYVATTRAADYLILSAGFKKPECKAESSWLELLASRFDLDTGTYTGPSGEKPPAVRVTCHLPELSPRQKRSSPPDPEILFAQAQQQKTQPPAELERFWSPVSPDGQAVAEFSFSRLDEPLKELLGLDSDTAGGQKGVSGGEEAFAAEVGRLVHEVLARWDFATSGADALEETLRRTAALRALEQEEIVAQAEKILRRFFRCPLPRRLQQARTLWRELEFLLAWPLQGPSRCLFRGFIDCLFCDAQGRWHLVDFKTSTAEKISLEDLAQRYKPQLWLYAQAAGCVLKQEPQVVEVWFLRHGQAVPLSWSPQETRRLCEKIDRAVERVRREVVAGSTA